MSNFDWLDYDESPVFKQGIAIVKRYGKFGAVMVGGKEIVPSIYDDLTEFKDGFATAKWNDEKRIVNLSGQIRVFKGGEEIFLPEEYDWGFDFVENVCVVVKIDEYLSWKYGIIDCNFNVRLECEYDGFTNYHNGYAIFSKDRWSKSPINVYNEYEVWSDDFLIDNKGKVSYKIKESFTDGHKIACSVGDQQKLYGVMDSNMQIIIPIIYTQINRLKNGLYVADSTDGVKLFLDSEDGEIISEKVVDDIVDISKHFFCTYREDKVQKKWETCIYTSPESMQLCIPSQIIHVESDENGNVIFEYNDLKYRYDLDGNLSVIAKKTQYGYETWMCRWDKIIERKVKHNYLNYIHKPFSDKYEIIEDAQNKKGLSDLEGNEVFMPQYTGIHAFTENLFIVSIPSDNGNSPKFGIVDVFNSVKIPFTFNYLIPINDKYLAYTDDVIENRNFRLTLPSSPSSLGYDNIKFGIIDVYGNKVTLPIFSTIEFEKQNSVFIVGVKSEKYSIVKGIVNAQGQYIIESKYSSVYYNERTNTFVTGTLFSKSANYPFETKFNNVSLDGYYLVKDYIGKIIKVPSQIVDWCGDFSEDGIACVIKSGHSGHINELNQIVSFMNDKKMIMPSNYDFICDFKHGYAPVILKGKCGIVNAEFKLIIPCEYEYIEALSDNLFKFKKGDNWGVIDKSRKLIAEADYINITNETEVLFRLESHVRNGSSTGYRHGFLDRQGKVIVPAKCEETKRIELEDNIFFITEIGWGQRGVFDKNGNIIIPFIYSKISTEGSLFYCNSGNINNVYRFNGEHLLYIDDSQYIIIPVEYEYAHYVGNGLIQVSKAEKWGIIDIFGQIIAETKYTSIDKFDGSFARVGISLDDKGLRYGLIDTSGEIVLPIEYEEIEMWDNGYYAVRKDGLCGLLSPTLHIVIEPSKRYLEKFDEKYIFIEVPSEYSTEYMKGLIDYYGNEIIPAYKNFSEIIVLENGFLKVIYDKSQYKGFSSIGILNCKGREVYRNDKCDDITYIDNGLLLIKGYAYNIANLQGKVLFDNYYDYIEILENGNFLIHKNGCYGMAKNTGEIFIPPKYTNRIEFENGIAKVQVKGSSEDHFIDTNGQVIVLDSNKNEVKIPKNYYWGTDFIKGISIVRVTTYAFGSVYGSDKIGVINEVGEVVIPPQYDNIKLLSDNTLLVYKYNSYGLFDITGKCLLPDIFSTLEHINKDRIRVIWNLDEIQSEYTPDSNNFLRFHADYIVNYGSALCDTKGNIISDKNLVWVGQFNNGYARCSLIIKVDNNNVILKQIGIIDINGTIIIAPEYDGITLYHYPYALLRKGNVYGIADLKNRKTILFNDINIKKAGYVDSFGRLIYTDGDCSNQAKNKGVIGLNGIILPSGKYSNIDLLENGLIKVSNEEHTLYGLLDLKGKELLKMEYTFISSFMYGYATVCIDGHYEEDDFTCKLVGGKWGIIDKTGKFIVKCIHDEKQRLSAEDVIKYNLIDDSEFDSHGRLLINEWDGNIGVIGLNGIIVPMGKYSNIQLLDNGLIKVSNKKNTFDSIGELYGLLDSAGKELLEMKYSYISKFKNGYASIFIGVHDDGLSLSAPVGGKWGMIDSGGNIVSKCENNEELVIPSADSKPILAEDATDYRKPVVLLSDYIPKEKISYSDNYYYDNYDDDYDNGYSKYGGYNGYDDQTIDDAFEGDPSLTWNID